MRPLILMAMCFVALLGLGCEEKIYAEPERRAKTKFEGVPIGANETELLRMLGEPYATIAHGSGGDEFIFRVVTTNETKMFKADKKGDWPQGLRVFAKCKLHGPAQYFVDGTVSALFVLDEGNRITCKDVFVS